jgi:hypothetical protein
VRLTAASQLQPGQTIAVKIDPDDPNVVYPDVPWATYTGSKIIDLGGGIRALHH